MTRFNQEDDDNILQDGQSFRVSMTQRDSLSPLQRSVAVARDSKPVITDGRTTDPTALNRPGFRVPTVNDRKATRDAYAEKDFQDSVAWRTDAQPRGQSSESGFGSKGPIGQRAGDICMTGGHAPGHLHNINDQLVCVPDPDDYRTDSSGRTVDQRQAEYLAYDQRISSAWKTP